MNLTKFQVIKIGTIIILSFASLNGICAELVKSNCDWKPPPPNSLQILQSNKLIELSESKTDRQKSEDNDFFKNAPVYAYSEKHLTYFNTQAANKHRFGTRFYRTVFNINPPTQTYLVAMRRRRK